MQPINLFFYTCMIYNKLIKGNVHGRYLSREINKKQQENEEIIIKSSKNVLRGLHFQKGEGQAKLVRVIDGKLFCVILDINKDSNTFGKWISIWLDDEYKEIFVPRDCALGTFAVEDSVFSCYSDGKYVAKDCSGIIWNDTDLNIDWPLKREPVLSKKDQDLCKFVEYKKYEG